MAEFPLTLLWTALGYWGEIFLYDGFSKRRSQAGRFWMISIGYISLNSLLLCTPFIMSSAYAKIPLAITLYTLFHFTQYTVNGGFTLYIAVIYYAIKYSLQGTTQGRYLTGGVPPVRFSM